MAVRRQPEACKRIIERINGEYHMLTILNLATGSTEYAEISSTAQGQKRSWAPISLEVEKINLK